MIGNYLLDTNIVIALWKPDNAILAKLAIAPALFLSSTVIGELFYGAYRSGRILENVKRVEEFADGNTIIRCDTTTARYYGQIKQNLIAKGRPIPENDIWIAAAAQQHDLILITRDAHFTEIEDLKHEVW
jgi:tRNA(fMet)-specific endonuclease VapC